MAQSADCLNTPDRPLSQFLIRSAGFNRMTYLDSRTHTVNFIDCMQSAILGRSLKEQRMTGT